MKKKLLFILQVCICLSLFLNKIEAQIKINEVMVSNTMYYDEIGGNFSDWIELYNSGTSSVNINGYYVSDDPANPDKWKLNQSLSITGKGFARIVFDEIDDEEDGKGIAANFRLEPKGSTIYVYNQDKQLVDEVTYPKLNHGNVSYGRIADGGDEWSFMAYPTVRSSNSEGEPSNDRVADPVFNEEAGFFTGTKTITLSCSTPGAKIYYTLNGDEPFDSKGGSLLKNKGIDMLTGTAIEYKAPIILTESTVIRAKVYAPGYLPSSVITRSFLLKNRTIGLPVFSISINPKYRHNSKTGIWANPEDRTMKRPSNIEFFPSQDSMVNFNYQMNMEMFGASQREKIYKQFNIIADKRYQGNNRMKYDFFIEKKGQKRKSVTLRTSGQDGKYTFMRDGLIQLLIKDYMDIDRRAYQPAVVFMNGKYHGLMNIRERTQKDYIESNYGYKPEDEQYDLLGIHFENGNKEFKASRGNKDHWYEMVNYMKNNSLSNDANYQYVIDNYIDEIETINYFVTQTYINNWDWPDNNIKAWRPYVEKGNAKTKWRYILHDLDRGFYSNSEFHTKVEVNRISDALSRSDGSNTYETLGLPFHHMRDNKKFREKFAVQYITHAYQTFSPWRTIPFIDSLATLIQPEIQPTHDHYDEVPSESAWKKYVQDMKNWMGERQKYVITHLKSAFNFPGNETDFSIEYDNAEAEITLNTVKLIQSFNGKYIQNLPFNLSLIPKNENEFLYWDVTVTTSSSPPQNDQITENTYSGNVPSDAIKMKIIPILQFKGKNKRYYIKEGGKGDGSSWAQAYGDLQQAINQAQQGDTLWVAKGTYKPNRRADNLQAITPNDRNNAFVLKKNVKIYGGFSGYETHLDQRDPLTYPSILSGDLGVENEISDNAYHIVISSGNAGSSELNGFTITGAKTNGSSNSFLVNGLNIIKTHGGGIYLEQSSPTLTNLIIQNNQSQNKGGGIYMNNGSSPVLNHLTINNNQAEYGGGIYSENATLNLSTSTISNNQAKMGGGIYSLNSQSQLINNVIKNNKGYDFGGGIFNKYTPVEMTNLLITGNQSGTGGGIFIEGSDESKITNCTISANKSDQGIGLFIHSMKLQVLNSIIWGNSSVSRNIGIYNGSAAYYNSLVAGATDTDNKGNLSGNADPLFIDASAGDYQLQPESPVIDNGDNTYIKTDVIQDLAENQRIINDVIDMGAYEYKYNKTNNKNEYKNIDNVEIINISPNPVQSGKQIYIEVNNDNLKNLTVDIYDITGNKVSTIPVRVDNTVLTDPQLKGIYIMKVLSEGKLLRTFRFIVE
ncbi:MAG: CotH kinase family protein [Flavobacteriaceae bacterium]|jgi:predicted outer membrane repeat protein|nr:CotH kinase family protein [Flavobacteriaceae bacterium]